MSWESREAEGSGVTRRQWVRLSLAAAGLAAGAAATGGGAFVLHELLPSPRFTASKVSLNSLVYTPFPQPQWWNSKAYTPVRASDFAVWTGATAVWRGLFDSTGAYVPGTGFPVLVIRVPRVDTYYALPSPLPWTLGEGFSLYYDNPALNIRIVAGFDRCTHLCCYPGWHVVTNPPPGRDYLVPPPTYDVYAQDPVYCICHGTQYDPLLLLADTNPNNGVLFPGMQLVHGPGTFAMPLVPLRAHGDVLEGGMVDPRWYVYC